MKNSRTAQKQSKPLAVALVLIFFCGMMYRGAEMAMNDFRAGKQPTAQVTSAPRVVAPPTPTVNTPSYRRIETTDEWLWLPNDVDFRSCPLLSCDVVKESEKESRILAVGFIVGEVANDISFDMWAIVRFDDVELFAPMSDVFPMTAEATEDGE